MGFESIELEIRGKPAAIFPESAQQFPRIGFFPDFEDTIARDLDFDFVAFLEIKRLDDGGGQANRQAVPPFCNLHRKLRSKGIYKLHCISMCLGSSANVENRDFDRHLELPITRIPPRNQIIATRAHAAADVVVHTGPVEGLLGVVVPTSMGNRGIRHL
jgi:hypothetical protein